ncbi:MAG: tetratricopeptide repeat protein, partial [Phycisphaerales bacterium]|nr:tetratricopeptide repeat protein [Phycisphaerales bacterium]
TKDAFMNILQISIASPEDAPPSTRAPKDTTTVDEAARFIDGEPRLTPLEVAQLANLIGLNYLWYDDYVRALEYGGRGLEIRQRLLQAPDAELAESLHTMGRIYWRKGDYPTAERNYQESLDMRRALFGAQHKDVAMSMSHLAATWRAQGLCDKAEPLCLDVLAMRQALLGDSHDEEAVSEVAASFNNLAQCRFEQGRYLEALNDFEKALAIIREIVGDDENFRVARTLYNAACCLIELGDFEAAQSRLDQALEIQKRLKGTKSREVAAILYQSARLHYFQGDDAQALTLALDALETQNDLFGDHRETANTLLLLGMIRIDDDPQQAEADLQHALRIRQQRLPAGHRLIGQAELALGACLLALHPEEQAQPALERGRDILKVQGIFDAQTVRLVRSIVEHYERAGMPEMADSYRALLP